MFHDFWLYQYVNVCNYIQYSDITVKGKLRRNEKKKKKTPQNGNFRKRRVLKKYKHDTYECNKTK